MSKNEQFPLKVRIQIDRLINYLEIERFNILTIFIWIFFLSALRMWTEAVIFDYPYKAFEYQYIFQQLHIICFYFSAFLGGVLIVRVLSGQKLSKLANLTAWGFIFVLLPPFLEKFVFQRTEVYQYLTNDQYLGPTITFYTFFILGITILAIIVAFTAIPYAYKKNINWKKFLENSSKIKTIIFLYVLTLSIILGLYLFSTGILTEAGGIGLLMEIITIMALSSIYVYLRTSSPIRSILNIAILFGFIGFLGTPTINPIINIWLEQGSLAQPNFIPPFLLAYYIILSVIFLMAIMIINNKDFVKSYFKSIRPFTAVHAIIMVLIGIIVAGNLQIDLQNITDSSNATPLGILAITISTVLFLWLSTLMLNQVYDKKIDEISNKNRIIPKGFLSEKQVKRIAIIFAATGLGLAFTLNLEIFILAIIALFFGVIYSLPPIRLRNSIISTTIIGIGSMIGFLIGYFAPSLSLKLKIVSPTVAKTELIQNTPTLTYEATIIAILIFVLLSIGPLVTDLKDYEGDKKAGVKSVYTVFGKEKGIVITSILLFIAFISPLLLFNDKIYDFMVFPVIAFLAAITFKTSAKYKIVLGLYFPVILYCLIRWYGLIN